MRDSAVRASGLRVAYPDGREVTIGGLPFDVRSGGRAAIVGPNGSGKSTLLRAILGLVRPTRGEVRVLGHDPEREFDRLRSRIGVVMQDVDAQLLAPTVAEDLAFGLGGRGLSPMEIQARVQLYTEHLGIVHLLDRVPHYLSVGERRRVALAGALVIQPDLLVLDEPFAGLDPRSRLELIRFVLDEHQRRDLTLVLTTHEMEELPSVVDTVFVMLDDGTLAARGTPWEIFRMQELLTEANVRAPQLTQLREALAQRGLETPATFDVDALADAIVRITGTPEPIAQSDDTFRG